MADVRDWGQFARGRWDWTRGGYEGGFPRGCQFTDVDAAVEFDGRRLIVEAKSYDGVGVLPGLPATGQLAFLRDEARLGKRVFVLYGCGPCNDPWAMHEITDGPPPYRFVDWRKLDKPARRAALKTEIDWALGVFH